MHLASFLACSPVRLVEIFRSATSFTAREGSMSQTVMSHIADAQGTKAY